MSLDIYLIRKCNVCNQETTVFESNITHNLNRMASEAGLYLAMWRPEEIEIKRAKDIISILETGLKLLLSDPERFKKYNPPNGWGDYDGFVTVVTDYLENCKKYPETFIETSK